MSKGRFLAILESINLENSVINIGRYYSNVLIKGNLPKDSITFFSILKTLDSGGQIGTKKLEENMLFCLNRDSDMTLLFTPETVCVSFQISHKELEKLEVNISHFENRVITPSELSAKVASKKIYNLIHLLHSMSYEELQDVEKEMIYKTLLSTYVEAFSNVEKVVKLEDSSYTSIANKSYFYIRTHADCTIDMCDISEATKTSERTLQRSFKRYYNTTLQNFIKIHRLHQVHKDLLANFKRKTITEIALDHGFSHLSRFSQYYKEFFGELPSETYIVK